MKNTMKFLGFIALVAVIGFTMAACPGDDGGGNNSPKTVKYESTDTAGNTYILIITIKGTTAAEGDSYVLTIKKAGQPDKVSTGTVSNAGAGTITLQPGNSGSDPFTVTVSNGQMTAITGNIAVEGAEEPVASPGTLTPVTTGGNGTTDPLLNGTWVAELAGETMTYKLNNGNFELSLNDVLQGKGTYVTGDGKITMTTTHKYVSYPSEIEPKLYSRGELETALKSIGWTDENIARWLDSYFSTTIYGYSVDDGGKALTLTFTYEGLNGGVEEFDVEFYKPVGGNKSITITGITGMTGDVSITLIGSNNYAVALGEGTISGTSVTLPIYKPDESLPVPWTPWTGSGYYVMYIGFFNGDGYGDGLYFYTDGKTYDELGIYTEGDQRKLPRYLVSSITSTIPFSKFKLWDR
jgi:hypothetical protein